CAPLVDDTSGQKRGAGRRLRYRRGGGGAAGRRRGNRTPARAVGRAPRGGGPSPARWAPRFPAAGFGGGRCLGAGPSSGCRHGPRIEAASPFATTDLYLVRDTGTTRVAARGGIPSLERALGDPETSGMTSWKDSSSDEAWTGKTPGSVLALIDRFHPIPDAPD